MHDTPLPPLAELRRAACAVKSRHPLAVAARQAAKQGGGPRRSAKAAPGPMDQLASANLTQKGSATSITTTPALPVVPGMADVGPVSVSYSHDTIPAHLPANALNPPQSTAVAVKSPLNAKDGVLGASLPDGETPDLGQWGDGSVECAVYCRPLNPRILLVTFKDGSHGRIVCHPKERARFCPGDALWVKAAAGKDLYILAGRYNRRGVRVR